MKFKYRYLRDKINPSRMFVKVPVLPVRLHHASNHIDIACLLDTGSADCLFDIDVADDLGIDVEDGDEKEYYGISGGSVIGYVHKVELQVHGFNERIEIDAGFLSCKLPYLLIGEDGFFDNYEVVLRRYRSRFEVKSRSFLHRH